MNSKRPTDRQTDSFLLSARDCSNKLFFILFVRFGFFSCPDAWFISLCSPPTLYASHTPRNFIFAFDSDVKLVIHCWSFLSAFFINFFSLISFYCIRVHKSFSFSFYCLFVYLIYLFWFDFIWFNLFFLFVFFYFHFSFHMFGLDFDWKYKANVIAMCHWCRMMYLTTKAVPH